MLKKIKNNIFVILFYASFASNPLLFILAPENKTKNFIQIFSIFNLVFSFIITILFLNQNLIRRIKIIFYSSFVLFISSICFIQDNILYIFYIWMILFGDLIVSQIDTVNYSSIYRVINILSIIPLLFIPNSFEYILYFRILFSFCITSVIFIKNHTIKLLLIEKSTNFIVFTYLFYSGTLIFFSKFLLKYEVNQYKVWYMTIQIGLVLTLKELDFKTRSNSLGGKDLFKLLRFIKIALPLITTIFVYYKYKNIIINDLVIILFIYFSSLFFLDYSKKYLKIA